MKTKFLLPTIFALFAAISSAFGQETTAVADSTVSAFGQETTAVADSTVSTFGQGTTTIDDVPQIPTDREMVIRNNSRYYFGGVRVSRLEVLDIVAPYPEVDRQIRRGVSMKHAAIGLGIAGPVIGYVGMMGFLFSAMGEDLQHDPNSGRNRRRAVMGWTTVTVLGSAMTWTAVGLAIGSGGAQRKAMRLYNDRGIMGGYGDYGGIVHDGNAAYLSLGATNGGLGLQLRF